MMNYICPVCKSKLYQEEKSFKCENNHCYDISSKGYVNLYLNSKKNKNHGDNKLMVKARKDFLLKGYYDELREEIAKAVKDDSVENPIVLDAGCGECYYTDLVEKSLDNAEVFAVDISKDALSVGTRKNRNLHCCVASVFSLPFEDESFDTVISIFSPFCKDEYQRVLKKNGMFLMVIPKEEHLFNLKELIYDEPYKNEVKDFQIDGFEFKGKIDVDKDIEIDNNEDIMNLFMMTPYYYKTGEKEQSRARQAKYLKTKISFAILLYKKR